MHIALLAAILLLAALNAGALYRASRPPRRGLAGRTVVVHTEGGESVRGIVASEHADRLTLEQAFYLHHGGNETRIDGLWHAPRARITGTQELE